MSNGLNIYSSINTFTWKPINFQLENDQFALNDDFILFDNGFKFNIYEPFKNCVDFSFNNKTGMVLTNLTDNETLFSNKRLPNIQESLTLIESPIGFMENGVFKIIDSLDLEENALGSKKVLKNTKGDAFGPDQLFYFQFIGGDFVKIFNHDRKVLTITSNENNLFEDSALSFENEFFPPNERQVFEFILSGNKIIFFKQNSNKGIAIRKSSTGDNFKLTELSFGRDVPYSEDMVFIFVSYKKQDLDFNKSVSNSFLVKYKTDLVQDEEYLTFNKNFTNNNRYIQNYLALFPVENPKISNSSEFATYTIYIHGLKNYQTPEYQYSTANPIVDECPSIKRIYNKIFSGTNQKTGYEKLFLGYQSDTKEILFPKGTETPFYFPPVSLRSPLSSSGLIEDGATPGELPYTSDRISMYRMNYEEITPGQPNPESIGRHDRTWLCSWLSGTNSGDKIWMDRYYNAAYYTLDDALTAKAHVYNEKIHPDKEFVYDIPSTMYMEPGILYKYDRIGIETSKKFVSFLNSDKNLPKGSNVLSLTHWISSPIVLDESNYNHNAIIFNNTSKLNFNEDYYYMDGSAHAIVPPSKEILTNTNFTASIWLSVDNWEDIQADQIFGNYYDSGFGLINQGVFNVCMFTIINSTSANAISFNYNFNNQGVGNFYDGDTVYEYTEVQRLPDYTYWVFDLKNKHGLLFSPFNSIEHSVSFENTVNNIDQIELDSEYNIYLYDSSAGIVAKLNPKGVLQSYITLDTVLGYKRIDIDKYNQIVGVHGNVSVVDNENNLWEAIGGNLYKNKKQFAIVGEVEALAVDSNNDLFLAHDGNAISKLDIDKVEFVFTTRVGKKPPIEDPCNPSPIEDYKREIDFVKMPYKGICDKKAKLRDILLVFDNKYNEILKISTEDGTSIGRLDLNGLDINIDYINQYTSGKGFTGFQFARKFLSIGKKSASSLAWKLKIGHPSNHESTIRNITLTHPTSTLPRGWHNFSFVFDSNAGSATYYIDSILVDVEYIDPKAFEVIYDYRSSILIGAASVRNTTVNDIAGLDDFNKYVGNVGDIKMYATALTHGEIEQVYFSSNLAFERPDLVWNRKVGSRSFVEEVEHWYKAQLPGSKSKYFNINVYNLNIDEKSKILLEDAIRENIKNITPANNKLYKINWK